MTKKPEDNVDIVEAPVEEAPDKPKKEEKPLRHVFVVTVRTSQYSGSVEFENRVDALAFLDAAQQALRTSPVWRWSETVILRSHEVAVELEEVIG